MAAAGAVLLAHGSALPAFTDEMRAMDAFSRWFGDAGMVNDRAGDVFASFLTDRYPLIDAGCGLILAGAAAAMLTIGLFATASADGPWLRTPRHRRTFVAVGVGALISGWAATLLGLLLDFGRLAFPACADSIAIPIFRNTVLLIVAAPVLSAIGYAISRGFGDLPAALGTIDRERRGRSLIVSLFFLPVMAGGAAVTVMSLRSTDALCVPALVIALYLLESTRSALLAERRVTPPS